MIFQRNVGGRSEDRQRRLHERAACHVTVLPPRRGSRRLFNDIEFAVCIKEPLLSREWPNDSFCQALSTAVADGLQITTFITCHIRSMSKISVITVYITVFLAPT